MSDPAATMKLPRQVDPRKLANQGAHLQGCISPEEVPRLANAVVDIASIEVDVTFDRDEEHRSVVEGGFRLDLRMTCQRCLQPVGEHIEGELHVGVVWDENQASLLPKRLDPWIVDADSGDLYEVLEDEFLLALPIVPFHAEDQCPASGSYSTGEHEETRENPFDILAKLKK